MFLFGLITQAFTRFIGQLFMGRGFGGNLLKNVSPLPSLMMLHNML